MHIVYGSYAEKINMSYFCLNLGQTAEDSDMFTIIWLRSRGLISDTFDYVRSKTTGFTEVSKPKTVGDYINRFCR